MPGQLFPKHLFSVSDKSTISSIDCWMAFEQVYTGGSFFNHRVALVKHFHGISPTGKIAHRNDPSYPAGCPSCDCPLEDEDLSYCANHLSIANGNLPL
jgi:hypothetical protein